MSLRANIYIYIYVYIHILHIYIYTYYLEIKSFKQNKTRHRHLFLSTTKPTSNPQWKNSVKFCFPNFKFEKKKVELQSQVSLGNRINIPRENEQIFHLDLYHFSKGKDCLPTIIFSRGYVTLPETNMAPENRLPQ